MSSIGRDRSHGQNAARSGHFRPNPGNLRSITSAWWAREDSNLQPSGYEPLALTIELRARRVAGRRRTRAFRAETEIRRGPRKGAPLTARREFRARRMPDRAPDGVDGHSGDAI